MEEVSRARAAWQQSLQRPHRSPPGGAQDALPRAESGWRGSQRLEQLVPGTVVETPVGSCYLVEHSYGLGQQHGAGAIGQLLNYHPSLLAPFHPPSALEGCADFSTAAFLDTETTGLGAGAGVYAFMVGVGIFEEHPDGLEYVVRQFFMRSPAEEPALLYALGTLLNAREVMVTFNGRSFDLPLLRARYALNRSILPAEMRRVPLLNEGSPHLDLLLPARRLWKRRLQSCRLVNLESAILGLERSQEDVPGFLIPQLYVDYVRSGRAGEMQRVFYHNQEDIVTTAALAQQMCQAVHAPHAAESALRGLDWVSLAQNHEQSGNAPEAERCYLYALERLDKADDQRLALQRLAVLYKRMQRWEDAAALWERWLSTVPGADAAPYIELSMYYEWKRRDLEQAEMWAAWGLHTVQAAPQWQRLPGQMTNLEQRLERIRRKRGA